MKRIKIFVYFLLGVLLMYSCKKEYSYESGSLKVTTGSWQFNDSTKLYSGNMDSAYIDSSALTTTKSLHLVGTSLDGTQSFNLILYASSFTTGTYKASLFQSSFQYSTPAKTIYKANQLIGEFIVNITTFSSNVIEGTFSGAAIDSSNKLKQLTLGKFTSSISTGASGSGTSSGALGDSSGNCAPVTIAGIYAPGIALTSSNTVKVQVNVTTIGSYSISTNTVNGVIFSSAGTFSSTGAQTVTLTGTGTPASAGIQNFTVKYGNSQCSFNLNFANSATGSLGGGGGACTPFLIAGTYKQNMALGAANTVQIQVNVATIGTYNIITNTVNGVTFSSAGSFTTTGLQNVMLVGSGTPVNAGSQTFTVTFGTSNCTFNILFLPSATASNDYFPLTVNSNWTYALVGGTASDSIHAIVINYSPVFATNTYKTIVDYDVLPTAAYDSLYYRKPGGDYYQYTMYSNYLPFDGNVSGEYIFLKDNVPNGTTWTSPNITGTVSGLPVTASIKMTIIAKAVAVSIGAFNFPDVIKVKYEYFITGSPVALETDERWFAKNVGEIHDSLSNSNAPENYDIGAFQVY